MRNAILGFCAALVLVAAAAFMFRDKLFAPEQAPAVVEAPAAPAGGLGGAPPGQTVQVTDTATTPPPEATLPSVVGTWSTRLRAPGASEWSGGNDWTFHEGGQVSERGFPMLPQERWSQRGRTVQFYSADQTWNGTLSTDGNTITGTSTNNYQFSIARR